MIRKIIIVVLTLAAIASVALAVASYRIGAYLYTRPTQHRYLDLELCRGWLCIEGLASSDPTFLDYWQSGSGFSQPETMRGYTCYPYGGAIWNNGKPEPGTSQSRQCLNLHFGAILFATYPALAFIRGPVRRYRRRKRGLCVTCGYDLRGSPGGCPECGAEI